MVLEEVAQALCQPSQPSSLPQRAIALFGFQVAILSPRPRSMETDARAPAALKILERMKSDTARDAGLDERLQIPNYREILDQVLREGGETAAVNGHDKLALE
jgi:hypothetical protein